MGKSYLGTIFSAGVRRALADKGMSQNELARQLDVSSGVVSRMLSGDFQPTTDTQEAVAKVLKVKLPELFTQPTPPPLVKLNFKGLKGKVLGTAGAGVGRDALEEEEIDFDRMFAGKHFARVRGDSMAAGGILDGDFIAVRAKTEPKSNDVVVCWVATEEGVLVKVLQIVEGIWSLWPRYEGNPKKPAVVFNPAVDHYYGAYAGLVRPGPTTAPHRPRKR